MRTCLLALILATTCAVGAGREATPLEVKGFRLGGTKAQVLERFPFLECHEDSCAYSLTTCDIEKNRRCDLADDYSVGDIPITWLVTLKEDRVTRITFVIGAMNFDELVLALVGKFGKPTTSKTAVVQNAFGAKVDDNTITWKRADGEVQAMQHIGSLTRSAVSFSTPEGTRQAALDTLRRASKAASGL